LISANDYDYFLKINDNSARIIHKFVVPLQSKVKFAIEKDMNQKITHAGVVDSIDGRHIKVRIVQQAACASCKVAAHCNASEAKEKLIDVYTNDNTLRIGQEVTVSTSGKAVRHAILLGFGIPLLLLTGTIIAAKVKGSADDTAALLAIGLLIPYYISIWTFREKIAKGISFQIEN